MIMDYGLVLDLSHKKLCTFVGDKQLNNSGSGMWSWVIATCYLFMILMIGYEYVVCCCHVV